MKNIFKILVPGLILIFTWACEKNYNEEPSVEFYAANKYQFDGNNLTFIDSTGQVVTLNANGASNTTAETLGDSILIVSSNFYAVEGDPIFYYIKGRANGLVVYPGDSVGVNSRKWEDYPYATGTLITLDSDSEEGLYELGRGGYRTPGEYTTNLVATNFYDPYHDPQEKVYSLNVKVFSEEDVENFIYNVVDTNALKTHFGLTSVADFDEVLETVFMR